MKPVMVFLDNRVIEECDTPPKIYPKGAIIRQQFGFKYGNNQQVAWARAITATHLIQLNLSDVPPAVKAICTLLNIPIT